MFNFLRATAIGSVLLALGAAGQARAIEREEFENRIQAAAGGNDTAAALRTLDTLSAEALQAGRIDLRALATAAHARLRLRTGSFDRVRQDLEEARAEARAGGSPAAEAWVNEVMAEYWQSQGDPLAAASWLDVTWPSAMAAVPAESDLALRALARLGELREGMGQDHLAAQARGWEAMLRGTPGAPSAVVALQPTAMSTQVAAEEIGRARLFLANATPSVVTGTLLVDGGDLSVRGWESAGAEERVTLRFPASAAAVPHSTAQGRKLTLRPGETRTLILEVEPNSPPRPGVRRVAVTWQAGEASTGSTADFHFAKSRDLPGTSVANSCEVRLHPLLNVPVHMEVYHRDRPKRHIQDLLPVASRPCRVELYEIMADGSRGRQWLALDADGDGNYYGTADAVAADRNGSGYPDVEFGPDKEVAALEIRLYPLAAPDGSLPDALDLTVSLRDGERWRQPADVNHHIEVGAGR